MNKKEDNGVPSCSSFILPPSSFPANPDDVCVFRTDESARDPLELALTEFVDQIRLGKTPSIDEFAERYPTWAGQIRELFPLVGNLERLKTEKEIECLRRNVPKQFSLDRLGDYQLVRELGRGGMGVVFQAFHVTSHRAVAIKLLPWRFAADMPVWKDRLQREAATIAALQHPNIVQIYSFSEDQGYYYYVMQLVEGVGLDKIIQDLKQQRGKRRSSRKPHSEVAASEAPLTHDAWKGFARIGEQVALALACAHEHKVLHNDIKPSNLLMRSNGQVIVTDFGIGQPQPGVLSDADDRAVGTLRYMAPERLTGIGDPTSDVYSLGVTLYELTTQTPIFDVQKRSRLNAAILHQQPRKPRQLIPDFPSPLERIILKAMAKASVDRYSSARALAEDLRRFINRQPPIHAAEPGILNRATAWCKAWSQSWRQRKK